jgi:insertion element IS1 protein InsB
MLLHGRLKRWNAAVFFADGRNAYGGIIPSELLVQTESETRLVESNNAPQRHWFARFRRRTCTVSRSLPMIDLSVMPYAKFHVNASWRDMVFRGRLSFQI